jgi:hypothetical protein
MAEVYGDKARHKATNWIPYVVLAAVVIALIVWYAARQAG